MTNQLLLALNEFMAKDGPSSVNVIKKYNLTIPEFWKGYACLTKTLKGTS